MSTISNYDDATSSLDILRADRARRLSSPTPSPGTPGEGGGEGSSPLPRAIPHPRTSNSEISNLKSEIPNPKLQISPRRLAANRANALKSTGPKSPKGKTRSSKNALKKTPVLSLSKGLSKPLACLPSECQLAFQTH